MAIVFDGKEFAREKEEKLKAEIKKKKITPKIVSILVGDDKASALYTKLKKEAAGRVGVKFVINSKLSSYKEIIEKIKELNEDDSVNGIMVQLPLPTNLRSKTQSILNTINKRKDVDGLTHNSPFMPASVKAIKSIVEFAVNGMPYFGKKAAVIGAKGMVGRKTVEVLTKMGYKVTECDKDTRDLYAKLNGVDLVVSATGVNNLIRGEIIKEGVIAIDVGAPRGDFDFKSVEPRSSFITPVPGGVGPVTIISLFENLCQQ